ncbi:extracellular matrix protein 2 isoform X2 [Gadus morhua]|uniref:Extracellular matrix protein 2, female organ and adipocyte specific n=1 Tax=Gadus morhua TaxID=8049 RepID=A0A8C4Z0M6_GADMO|nr:extracellular matrix protein 2 isoform X2 [Gadus morhua]
MKWVLLLAALGVLLLMVVPPAQGHQRSGAKRERQRRGKKRRGGGGGRGPDRTKSPQMTLGPADAQVLEYLQNLDFPAIHPTAALHPPAALYPPSFKLSPVLSDPIDLVTPLTQEQIRLLLWHEEEQHRREEERLRRKDEERKRRRKQRKEQAERQRNFVAERRREEEEALKQQIAREEEEWRQKEKMRQEEAEREARERQMEEERRREEEAEREARERQMEEERRRQEEAEREAMERKMGEERKRQDELLREALEALEEENEEDEWLRGDVFQSLPNQLKERDLLPPPQPIPPTLLSQELEWEHEKVGEGEKEIKVSPRNALPPGCSISDVTMTCENIKLDYFPPLTIPYLKSLSLEGNLIRNIPAEAFNGIPNLEWINLGKNLITSDGIAAAAFRGLQFLTRLYLDGNLLERVPSNLPSTLQELKINENKLSTIKEKSLRGLSSLIILELEDNLLSENNVDPSAFSPLTQLFYLRLGRNHFRTVPQGLPPTLLELYLENNMIEEISEVVFNNTTSLTLVSLRHNRLDETRMAPLAWINHRSLESIDLSHNDLYLVPSYLPRSLIHLVLVGNHIERIPSYVFAHMDPGLEYLYLSYNKLDGHGIEPESFFGAYHSMVELCMDHNQLASVPAGISLMKALHFLRLNNNNIRSIPEDSLCEPGMEADPTLVAVRLENNRIDPDSISSSSFSCVRATSSVVFKPQRKD